MSYSYADRIVYLTDLEPEAHPMVHDLCELHAGATRAPHGWVLQDERSDLESLLGPRALSA